YFERHARVDARRRALCGEQREPGTEVVVERAAVGEPGVRRKATRMGGRHVVLEVPRRWRAAVVDDDRRAAVVVAEYHAERIELAHLRRLDGSADLGTQARSLGICVVKASAPHLLR